MRAGKRAVGLVEELESLMALALGQVRAIGREQSRGGDQQERQCTRVGGGQNGPAQREAGVTHRHHEVHRQHVRDHPWRHQPLGEGDRAGDQQDGHEATGLSREQHPDPGSGTNLVAQRRQRVHHQDRDARSQRELPDVEDELDRGQPALGQQHQGASQQAPKHDPVCAAEQQPENQWDVR